MNKFKITKIENPLSPREVYRGIANFVFFVSFHELVESDIKILKSDFEDWVCLENLLKTKYHAEIIMPLYFLNNQIDVLSTNEENEEQIGFVFIDKNTIKQNFKNQTDLVYRAISFEIDCYNSFLRKEVYKFTHFVDDKIAFETNYPQFYGLNFVNEWKNQMKATFPDAVFEIDE